MKAPDRIKLWHVTEGFGDSGGGWCVLDISTDGGPYSVSFDGKVEFVRADLYDALVAKAKGERAMSDDGLRFEWRDDGCVKLCDVGPWHLRASSQGWSIKTGIAIMEADLEEQPILANQRAAESALLSIAADINAAAGVPDVNGELLDALDDCVGWLEGIASADYISHTEKDVAPYRAVIAKAKGETT